MAEQKGQGELQAKIGALNSGLQSLNVVIDNLRQQGINGGLIFQALAEKISGLIKIEQQLTEELENQKIIFKNNSEQLEVYTKLQAKVQRSVDKTQKVVSGLLKEQIDQTKQSTRLEAEAAAAKFKSGKEQEKRELSLLDTIILRMNRERQENDRLAAEVEAAEKRKARIQKLNIDELERQQIASFNQKIEAEKQAEQRRESIQKKWDERRRKRARQAEDERKRVAKAQFDRDLKIIRSGAGSARKRLDAEIAYLKKSLEAAKNNAEERAKLEGMIAQAEGARRDTGFAGGLRRGFAGRGLGRAVGQLTGIGTAVQAIRTVFKGLQKAITDSFKAAVDFEAQLAQLQAVTGVTDKELDQLSRSVLDVAGSTTFTSEQIVELQTELGKLGFSTNEIVAATEGIARTAQALGEQVGPVAQKVGQILNQYNLNASETEKISDTLVSTINSSALSFEGFGTALQYIGPLAAQAGGTFQETAGAMAILADNGFTASRIGTGLRGILTELSSTGEDLTSVVSRLAKEQLSFSRAVELVGKRNAAQLISLIENVEVLAESETKYYDLGSALIASSQQTDTFKGNTQLLNSAINKLQISFGNLIKNSGLLKAALKLVDQEGYNAAKSAELFAKVDADGLEEATLKAARRMQLYNEYADSYTEKQLKIRKNGIINDFLEETAVKDLMEEREEILRIRNDENSTYLESLDATSRLAGIDIKIAKAKEAAKKAAEDLVEQTREQVALDQARSRIELRFKKDLEERAEIRRKDDMSLRKAVAFQVENEEKQKAIGEEIKQAKEEAKSLDGEALILKQAQIEQLGAEQQSYVNLLYSKDELFAFAQKEYELEFKNLQNEIRNRRARLKSEQDLLNIKRKTNKQEIENLAVRIENTEDAEEKKRLQEEQNVLIQEGIGFEKQLSDLQRDANSDVQGYLDKVSATLKTQRNLWRQAGFSEDSIRLLDKAAERLESYRQNVADLAVDFPEAIAAGDRLAQDLQQRFAESLKEGGMLTDADKTEINGIIDSTFKDFSLTEEQLAAMREYVFSFLKPDKKTKDDTKKEVDNLYKILLQQVPDVLSDYNDTALENTKNRLGAEIDAIKERYKIEEEIIKNQLQQGLITESQFRTKQQELKRKQIQEENEINRKIFEAEKKADINNVLIETAEAIAANAIKNYESTETTGATIKTALGYAAIVAAGAAKADAIRRRKFFPVQFEQGGMVEGPSHAQGGVPFTVQGQGGYEMEGGEFIVNKKAAAFHRSLLERINSSMRPNTAPIPQQFATGGLVAAQRATQINVNAQTEESVNYLKAIAHATISTANDVKKPVRAVVSSKDLRNNETERRLRERNDRI